MISTGDLALEVFTTSLIAVVFLFKFGKAFASYRKGENDIGSILKEGVLSPYYGTP